MTKNVCGSNHELPSHVCTNDDQSCGMASIESNHESTICKSSKDIEEPYQILMCSDTRMIDSIYVVIASLIANCKRPLRLWIMQSDFPEEDKKELHAFVSKRNMELHIIDVDEIIFQKIPYNHNWSVAAFYYLVLHHYLPQSVKKVLYLDVDVIVRKDISPLYDIDLTGYMVCACEEHIQRSPYSIACPAKEILFNSGVILINVEEFRIRNIDIDSIMALCNQYGVDATEDQIAINAIATGSCKLVPSICFNYRVRMDTHYRGVLINKREYLESFSWAFDESMIGQTPF